MKQICLLIILPLLVLSQQTYKKVLHKTDPDALCLDGSPAMVYLHEGLPDKFLFYFLGGASCADDTLSSTLQSCYQRSKMYLGSSVYWPQTSTIDGILSTDPSKNRFANWTKMVFIYCDGAFHQGYNKVPIKYKDTQLYFRGGPITRSHFKFASTKYALPTATEVVLTGSSAGGMATYLWADYLLSLLKNPTALSVVPDSSIFLDPSSPLGPRIILGEPQANLFKLSNTDQSVPIKKCAQDLGKVNQWACLNIQVVLPYVKTPMLFIQSSYDHYIIRYGADIRCPTPGISGYSLVNCSKEEFAVIEGYRLYYQNWIAKQLSTRGHSIWSISCSWHAVIYLEGYYDSPLQRVPMVTGITIRNAVQSYVFDKLPIVSIDTEAWPANSPCAY